MKGNVEARRPQPGKMLGHHVIASGGSTASSSRPQPRRLRGRSGAESLDDDAGEPKNRSRDAPMCTAEAAARWTCSRWPAVAPA
jgi:hypothetical protein